MLILFPMALLAALGFSCRVDDVSGRLGTTFTLLLTFVAFKLLIGEKLPSVPYSTWLDTFITGLFIFTILSPNEQH